MSTNVKPGDPSAQQVPGLEPVAGLSASTQLPKASLEFDQSRDPDQEVLGGQAQSNAAEDSALAGPGDPSTDAGEWASEGAPHGLAVLGPLPLQDRLQYRPQELHQRATLMEMADRLAQDGWRDLGYVYLNIDDCWIGGRDSKGRLIPDKKCFPNGIAFLADYAHSLGLKLGIYENLSLITCSGYAGTTLDTVVVDAQTFTEWKVDMLKMDGCFSTYKQRAKGYPMMATALNATGRPIAFSCCWPAYDGGLPPRVDYKKVAESCNLWRSFFDIKNLWVSVLFVLDWFVAHQDILQPAAGPGHWNDPDVLIIGNKGLNLEQARSQMALWTILAAPLFMSADLRSISPQNVDILQNSLMIKINQDPLGIQGRRVIKAGNHMEVFLRPLANEASAVVFFNRHRYKPYQYSFSLAQLNLTDEYEAQDVYSSNTINNLKHTTNFTVTINPSGVVVWYLYPLRKRQLFQH